MIQPDFANRGVGKFQNIQVTFSRVSVERLEGVVSTETPLINYDILNIILTIKR